MSLVYIKPYIQYNFEETQTWISVTAVYDTDQKPSQRPMQIYSEEKSLNIMPFVVKIL